MAALSLTACSATRRRGGSSGGSGTTVDITIKNGKVTPHGDRVKAEVGKPVTLKIDADVSGEIHVHSTPEQQIKFDKGTQHQEADHQHSRASSTSRTTPSTR